MDWPTTPMIMGKRVDDVDTLARDPLLAPLERRERARLVDLLEELRLPAGARMDEASLDGMYFVLEGRIRETHAAGDAKSLEKGEHFGVGALIGAPSSRSSFRAESTARLALLRRFHYRALVTSHPLLAAHLVESIAKESLEESGTHVTATLASQATPGLVRADSLLSRDARGQRIVGALLDNRPISLATPVRADAKLVPVPIASPEGRDIFLRTVGLLVLEALARVAPNARAQWDSSVGPTQIVRLKGANADDELARRVAEAAQSMVDAHAVLREEMMTVEDAQRVFLWQGWAEAAALLSSHKESTIAVVRSEHLTAPSMGPVLSDLAEIGHVRVLPHPNGLLVDLSEHLGEAASGRHHDTRIDPVFQESTAPRFGGEMATAHAVWLAALGITTVGSYNEACVAGRVSELIRASEGFHEKRIAQIADLVHSRRDGIRMIRIAGPSSSGKTTFIKRLLVQLEIDGVRPINLSLDDYYVDREKTPRTASGELDFESIDAIDRKLLDRHVASLIEGKPVRLARFDFMTGKSLEHGGATHTMTEGNVLVVEGLHALNPELFESSIPRERTFGIFIHPATTIPFDPLNGVSVEDVRLLRRIVRDRHQRGYSAAENIERFAAVRHAEQFNVFSCEPFADAVFDSSLVYELSIMKVFAERYLLEVPHDHASFPVALRLRALVDRFVAIYPEHVPPTSILREFIGESSFEY